MKKTPSIKQLMITAIASLAFMSSVQAADALKMELTANKVVKNAEGKVTYLPVRTAPAGTVIQYKATYTSTVNQNINDLAVTLPIPANMTFTGEVSPSSAQASVDNKNYADLPLMQKVNGKVTNVPLSEYRSVRWNIKLLPAKKSANVSLNTVTD